MIGSNSINDSIIVSTIGIIIIIINDHQWLSTVVPLIIDYWLLIIGYYLLLSLWYLKL